MRSRPPRRQAKWIARSAIVLAMRVAFALGLSVGRVEEVINEIERRIRGEQPAMKKIFIEPDSHGDGRGVAPEEAKLVGEAAS
jgi:divalent metal cation (Fe/Co/Zn/Cd) transporter